jgi:hypothetical protein
VPINLRMPDAMEASAIGFGVIPASTAPLARSEHALMGFERDDQACPIYLRKQWVQGPEHGQA